MIRIKPIMFLLAAAVILVFPRFAGAEERRDKPNRISWEREEGVERYRVQVKNQAGDVVLETEVEDNYIDLKLPPGKYRLRIGGINKFDKPGDWSDWEDVEIRRSKRALARSKYPLGAGLKIGGGMFYEMLLPPWKTLYKDSYSNYTGSVAWHLGTTRLGSYSLFRYTGIELEGSYGRFYQQQRLDVRSNMKRYGGGMNVFFRTNFDSPVNIVFRIGGGGLYSRQNYIRYVAMLGSYLKGGLNSLDPFARSAVSLEVFFLKALFLEAGVQYTGIFYIDKTSYSLRYFAQAGFRL